MELPLAYAFGRIPRELTRKFGSYLDAILVEDDLALPAIQQQQAKAVESDLQALVPQAVGAGSSLAWTCIELLLPIWSNRPVDEMYSGPEGGSELAKARSEGAPKGAKRFVERAEMYLAMEIVRALNHYLVACWLRVTLVTVLALLLLMVVNSYPFQPAGWLFGMMVVEATAAVLVVIWMIWGFQRNPLIRRVTGSEGRPVFNLDFLGKMLTYVGPLVAGLIAVFSFTASDVLRVMFGPLL
jgi:hypothetical protein